MMCLAILVTGMGHYSINYSLATTSDDDDEDSQEQEAGDDGETQAVQPIEPVVGSQGTAPNPSEFQNIATLADLISKWDNSVISGEIDSVLFTGPTTWIATGPWKMLIADGEVRSFDTDMLWYNANGSATHAHEIRSFEWDGETEASSQQQDEDEEEQQDEEDNQSADSDQTGSGTSQPVSGASPRPFAMNVTGTTPSIVMNGESDVGTNDRITWTDVPTTIGVSGGKVVSVLLGDEETSNHFARQNMYGIVSSVTPCGDTPGPNMQVLPPCE